jgi:[NiFe] hydrogenase assembly HybE family chaperone
MLMSERIRQPALKPPPVRAAVPRSEDPAAFLEAHYRRIWTERMHDLPFVNPALAVAAPEFRRCGGDWLGVVITPWFINLMLVAGGGRLWGDIPAGERRYVELPCGTLQFIADDDPDIGPYQYCPLIAPASAVPDMAAALKAAAEAMETVFSPPPEAVPAPDAGDAPEPAPVSRRAFFRRIAGRPA